jgi:hypothetical protein
MRCADRLDWTGLDWMGLEKRSGAKKLLISQLGAEAFSLGEDFEVMEGWWSKAFPSKGLAVGVSIGRQSDS